MQSSVTNWSFSFEGHKGCGDWQAAMGITFRVHHLTWVTMAGEAKRDFPACMYGASLFLSLPLQVGFLHIQLRYLLLMPFRLASEKNHYLIVELTVVIRVHGIRSTH